MPTFANPPLSLLLRTRHRRPWSPDYAAQFADLRMQVMAQALLAPSAHNRQPWAVQLDPDDERRFRLFADPTRLLPSIDPFARQALVSQGAFLGYLRVAAARLGREASISLFPRGRYRVAGTVGVRELTADMASLPVASVTLRLRAWAGDRDQEALLRSDPDPRPFAPAPLTSAQRAEFAELAETAETAETAGVFLRLYDRPGDRAALGAILTQAALIEHRRSPIGLRSGRGAREQRTGAVLRAVAATPAYAVISTSGDSRTDQVRAGMLLAATALRAGTLGLAVHPLPQALEEYPAMVGPHLAVHREFAAPGESIQSIVRLGTAARRFRPSSRRDAASLLRPARAEVRPLR